MGLVKSKFAALALERMITLYEETKLALAATMAPDLRRFALLSLEQLNAH